MFADLMTGALGKVHFLLSLFRWVCYGSSLAQGRNWVILWGGGRRGYICNGKGEIYMDLVQV